MLDVRLNKGRNKCQRQIIREYSVGANLDENVGKGVHSSPFLSLSNQKVWVCGGGGGGGVPLRLHQW